MPQDDQTLPAELHPAKQHLQLRRKDLTNEGRSKSTVRISGELASVEHNEIRVG